LAESTQFGRNVVILAGMNHSADHLAMSDQAPPKRSIDNVDGKNAKPRVKRAHAKPAEEPSPSVPSIMRCWSAHELAATHAYHLVPSTSAGQSGEIAANLDHPPPAPAATSLVHLASSASVDKSGETAAKLDHPPPAAVIAVLPAPEMARKIAEYDEKRRVRKEAKIAARNASYSAHFPPIVANLNKVITDTIQDSRGNWEQAMNDPAEWATTKKRYFLELDIYWRQDGHLWLEYRQQKVINELYRQLRLLYPSYGFKFTPGITDTFHVYIDLASIPSADKPISV